MYLRRLAVHTTINAKFGTNGQNPCEQGRALYKEISILSGERRGRTPGTRSFARNLIRRWFAVGPFMSETALRNVNAVLRSERRSITAKKAQMRVVLTGPNDENAEVGRGKVGRMDQPAIPAVKAKSNSFAQAEAQTKCPPVVEIEYIPSEDLKPLDEPDVSLESLLATLDSKDWLKVLEGLDHVRRLALFHSSSMRRILNEVLALVVKAVKNPRSALCKTAIMASSDLLKAYNDEMLDILDPLLLQLLLKATQDKKFVCEEAEKALFCMATYISPGPALEKLRPFGSHRNPRIRAKAGTCVYKCASRLGVDGMNDYGLDQLIQIAAAQLNDQLPEARESARKLVVDLHAVYRQTSPVVSPVSKPENGNSETNEQTDPWEVFCLSSLNPLTAQAVLRVTCVAN
ncbi:hypothetical protein R1sor_023023 [Riccia sorocarpa]|uniref:TOG domain-containing protein n=1 Tax=Riccia sorocarpa TaxID=122646 RepID=A0ABD3GNK5_9MARC